MSLLTHAPHDPSCNHALAYEIAHNTVHCYGCDAEWPAPQKESEAVSPAPKKRGRKASVGTAQAELPAPPPPPTHTDAVLDTELQDDGEADAEPGPAQEVHVPDASGDTGSVQKTSRRRKKAEAAPEVIEGAEAYETGPWHDSLKCPVMGCFSKLKHNPPNIVNNGKKTYHYSCENCEDVRVVVHIGETI